MTKGTGKDHRCIVDCPDCHGKLSHGEGRRAGVCPRVIRESKERKRLSNVKIKANNSGAWNLRRREYVRRYRFKHPDRVRAYDRRHNLRVKFNLDVEDYEALLRHQKGVCAICLRPPLKRRLAVDHSHDTGLVRGLLCSDCNIGLGLFGDSIESLLRATNYLRGLCF